MRLYSSKVTRWRVVVYICGLCCATYLLIQLFIFHAASDDRNQGMRDASDEAQGKDFVSSEAYMAIQKFTDACHTHALPVFLIDPSALTSLMDEKLNKILNDNCTEPSRAILCAQKCLHLCTGRPLTSFGIFADLWHPKAELFNALTSEFSIVYNLTLSAQPTAEPDLNYNSSYKLPIKPIGHAHLVLSYQDGRHFIHLVFFHLRSGSYLWHASLFNDEGNQTRNTLDKRGAGLQSNWEESVEISWHGDGAYDSFDLQKNVIDDLRLRVPANIPLFLHHMNQSVYIECNTARASRFYSQYGGRDTSIQAESFRQDGLEVLSAVKHVLDRLGVRFWLSSGTCLGWYRQCDLIPYSGDVDIGVFISEHDERLISALEEAGLRLTHLLGKVSDSYELSFRFEESSVKLDIFFFYEELDYVWNGGTQAKTGHKFKYIFPRFSLCWGELLGLRVRVPCETEAYLRANYGPDWFKPVYKWDWKKSPPNVRENGVWPSEELKQVVRVYQ